MEMLDKEWPTTRDEKVNKGREAGVDAAVGDGASFLEEQYSFPRTGGGVENHQEVFDSSQRSRAEADISLLEEVVYTFSPKVIFVPSPPFPRIFPCNSPTHL